MPPGTRQDLDAMAALYTDDVVFQNHTAGEAASKGAEAVRAHLAGIFERWPDLRFTRAASTCRDDFCTSEWTARATAARRPTDRMGRRRRDADPRRPIARKDVYSTSHIARDAPQS